MKLSRDIIKDLFRGGASGKAGLVCDFWDETIPEWRAHGYPVDRNGAPIHPAEHFNLDTVCAGGWFDWKCRPGVPGEKAFRIKSLEDWQNDCRAFLVNSAEKRVDKKVLNTTRTDLAHWTEKGKWTFYAHQFLWENMRESFGSIALCGQVVHDRARISDYCRVYTDLYKEAFKLLINGAGKPDGVWLYEDLGYKGATFCSPKMYGEILFPFYREMTDFFHERGIFVVMHSCGFVEPLVGMMAEVGIDGLHPLETGAGNDPLKIAREYGDKMVLIGGFDPAVLETGNREQIRKAVEDIINGMKNAGARYVFCPGSPISPKVQYDNFQYALDIFREYACR